MTAREKAWQTVMAVADLEKPIESPAIATLLSPKPQAEQSDIQQRLDLR